MKGFQFYLLAAAILAVTIQSPAMGIGGRRADRVAARHARSLPWHGPYYNTARGGPIPLVVPPTANMQTKQAWGVSQDTMTPIYHQFGRPYRRPYPGVVVPGGYPLLPTPRWPSHTDQFGVYYIRGPY